MLKHEMMCGVMPVRAVAEASAMCGPQNSSNDDWCHSHSVIDGGVIFRPLDINKLAHFVHYYKWKMQINHILHLSVFYCYLESMVNL